MKILKFFLMIVCMLASLGASSQTADVIFKSDEFQKGYTTILDGDTIKGTAEIGKSFLINKPFQYVYMHEVSAVKTVDGGSCDIIISGSINGVKYYALDTINWKMATADTTVLFNQTSGSYWKFIKGSIKGVGATTRAKLGNQHVRIAEYK